VIECIDHARSREVCGEVGGGKEFIEKWWYGNGLLTFLCYNNYKLKGNTNSYKKLKTQRRKKNHPNHNYIL
jgi:hypothetical protein